MQRFPTTEPWDTTLLGSHPLGSLTTPPLTITKIEWEDRSWGKVLKITFAENIKYSGGIFNKMCFLRFAEDVNRQYSPDAEAFFYFISKLNQPIQIPIRRSWIDEQGLIYWALSDEIIDEIKAEKNKWETLGYTEAKDLVLENKVLVERGSKKQNWKDIHEDFGKNYYGETYQRTWEEWKFTYSEAQKWIQVGFKPSDYYLIKEWKNQGFDPQTTKLWIEAGLKLSESWKANQWKIKGFSPQQATKWIESDLEPKIYELTAYLKWRGHQSQLIPDLEKLSTEFVTWLENPPAQEWIDCFYPPNQRNAIKELNLFDKNLIGVLDLRDFVSLEKLCCPSNQLTSLKLNNCTNLKRLFCGSNHLTSLGLANCDQLEILDCSNNYLKNLELPFSAEQLTYLNVANNNLAQQDLSIFQRLVNLENLDIANTNVDSGVEYLPANIEYFYCSAEERPEAKVKAIYNLFVNDQEEVEKDEYKRTKNFPQKLQHYKQWRKLNLSEKEIKQWINAGLTVDDYDLVFNYLKKEKSLTPQLLARSENRLTELRNEYHWWKKKFTFEQTKEWINAGAKPDDHGFAAWLRDVKKETFLWIANYQADYQVLSKRFKEYGLCSECNQPNTGEEWCQECNSKRFQQEFPNWTSGNFQVDKFLQKYQLAATDADKFIEWIPYEHFTDIEYLAEGGFGKVYKAKWTAGNIHHWDDESKQWRRKKDHYYDKTDKNEWDFEQNKNKYKKSKTYREVVLKSLNNSSENIEFLQETEKHKIIDDWFNNIVPCYGLSQDPNTGNYLMVMQYLPEGNLRCYLSKKNRKLSLRDKLNQLLHIAQGLKDIHQKDLVHRDFHSGNILKGIERTDCLITDLGLCKPVDETNKEDKIFGVMPYVAPEVLQSKPYTKASDVYSFGMVSYEMLSGLPPYYDREHGIGLAIKICEGLRPQLQIKIPQLLEDLIKRCWDNDPKKRPAANELEKTLRKWQEEINKEEETKFKKQLQEAEEFNKTLPDEVKFSDYKKKIHTGAVYHSQLLPTKEITRLLQTSQELSGSSTISMSGLLDNLPNTSLENKQTEQAIQIQNNDVAAENWVNPNFTPQLTQTWTHHHFTPAQAQEWININPPTQQEQTAQEPAFYAWLRDTKNLTPEQVLNNGNLNSLKQEYQSQQQAHIQQANLPPNN